MDMEYLASSLESAADLRHCLLPTLFCRVFLLCGCRTSLHQPVHLATQAVAAQGKGSYQGRQILAISAGMTPVFKITGHVQVVYFKCHFDELTVHKEGREMIQTFMKLCRGTKLSH